MEREYRQVIQNIKLTIDEAQTLYNAEKILRVALDTVLNPKCPYDKDLVEAINKGIDGLKECNPRLNVGIILGEK